MTIYTKSFGKILVRAKGVGKKESKLKSFLEPFNLCEFLLARSKTIDVLTGVECLKEFIHLRSNLESLALAFYFSELIDKLVVAPERDEKIWTLLTRAMEALEKASSTEAEPKFYPSTSSGNKILAPGLLKLKSAFEEKLIEFLGYKIEKPKDNLRYIQSLAGEEIKSARFLRSLSLSK